jgi:hypothetical protein
MNLYQLKQVNKKKKKNETVVINDQYYNYPNTLPNQFLCHAWQPCSTLHFWSTASANNSLSLEIPMLIICSLLFLIFFIFYFYFFLYLLRLLSFYKLTSPLHQKPLLFSSLSPLVVRISCFSALFVLWGSAGFASASNLAILSLFSVLPL